MEILFEDNHIIAINKTNSDIVQGDKTGDTPLSEKVKKYIKGKYNKPGAVFLGVTHRLDRPVSGAIMFARTSKSLSRLNEMFKKKEIIKTYWAIVKDKPKKITDTLEHYIYRDQKKNKSFASEKETKDSKHASLTYKLIASSENYHLLEINLHTGRHHQIRCQLAKIGCPIKGDLKYGFPRSNPDGGISLHAREIKFIHPVKKTETTITANPPEDNLWKYFLSVAD
ncbi:MAG: RluA family pseudouridine synthase [Bacteroidales bacterium]|nr:RluA family pseudouridine synthase [Bacteroidales bacterium]